jgi:hypothetical protein
MALEARAMKDDILIGDTPKAVKRRKRIKGLKGSGRLWKHSGLVDIYGLVTQEEIEGFFTLTLVRNPWDRLVSYYHWLRGQGFDHPAVRIAKARDFSGFLNDPQTVASIESWPYGRYMQDRNGQEQCRLFVRLEHLAQDLAPFEAHLGFALNQVPVSNKSARDADYRAYYSDADAALVARICAPDIARFGYGFRVPGE